jgi:hypothetical protein
MQLGIHNCYSANQLATANLNTNTSFRYDLNVQLCVDSNAGFKHRLDTKYAR